MRRLLVVLMLVTLLVPALPAFAEDVGAVLVAMPDQAAELRYLKQLCDRASAAKQPYLDSIEARTKCVSDGTCSSLEDRRGRQRDEEGARMGWAARLNDYLVAAEVYAAKRDVPSPTCANGLEGIAAKLTESTEAEKRAMQAPPATAIIGPKRSECTKACADVGGSSACYKSCERYPE